MVRRFSADRIGRQFMVGTARSDSEFSRPIAVDELGEEGLVEEVEATADERAAIAERLGLLSLEGLRGRFRLLRATGSPLIKVEGRIEAEVTQACVVSLEPVAARVAEDFSLTYSLEPEEPKGDLEFTLADEEPPENVEDGTIDLGEAAIQQLAVALNPYPRRPGAEIPEALKAPEGAAAGKKRPFEILRVLKGGKEG